MPLKCLLFIYISNFYKSTIFKNNRIFKLQYIYVRCVAGLTGVHTQGSRVNFNHVTELTLIKFCNHLILNVPVPHALTLHPTLST